MHFIIRFYANCKALVSGPWLCIIPVVGLGLVALALILA